MIPRILIVEDEPAIAETITFALRTEGFDVLWRSTGAEARRALEEGIIHLTILDIGLPDQNGFELGRAIRKESDVPIIFLTARNSEIDRVAGLELGADDYVSKPFSPRELAARVKAVLRRAPLPEIPSAPESGAAPFQIDRPKMKIYYFGHPLELSRYEYRLMEILIKRPGWVYSREKLMELVWDAPESSMDRTVDTHIKTLRAKLHKIRPGLEPIQTHRGLGYSLKEAW